MFYRAIFYISVFSLLAACADSKEFTGNSAKVIAKADKVISKLDKFIDNYLQSLPACDMEVVREAPDSTVCAVSVSVTEDLTDLTPDISPLQTLGPWKLTDGVFLSQVNCPASGGSIDAVFKAEIEEVSESGDAKRSKIVDVATCGAQIQPIAKPGCTLAANSESIDLGSQVSVTLSLLDQSIPISSSAINGVAAVAGEPKNFTPTKDGPFVLTGTVKNAASTETCSLTVTVRKPSSLPPVIPPNCALSADRENPLATMCDMTVASTGGPVSGLPTTSSGATLSSVGAVWRGKVACDATKQTLSATVKNSQGTSAVCTTSVPEIAVPECSLTAARKSAGSTRCSVTVAAMGGPLSEAPKIDGIAALAQKATSWEAVVDCDAGEKIFKASVKNPRGTSSCEAKVEAIKKPGCSITVDSQTVVLGQSVNATLKPVGDGEIATAKINGAVVTMDQASKFTPSVAGDFLISGSVQNPASTEVCSATVKVSAPPSPPPVIPPSCSVTASRIAATPTKCNVSVSSTGGPIEGLPVVGGVSLAQKGTGWEGVVACSASAQPITAVVSNSSGAKADCSTQLASIPIWVQTNGGVCSKVCEGVKRVSIRSPKYGNTCVSGEVRGDAVGIKYSHGTWGSGVEFKNSNSFGGRCYGSNPSKSQKQDNDATDITVGCYCK